MPATVQAAIAARIDRLSTPAKRTLNAASVIGARFGAELLAALGIDPVFDELLSAELIDQVRFTPSAEYAFHHPLIRAVAYESQLKSDRAEWHRRLATAIQERAPGSVEDNAALIAEHLQAAGELHAAYGWHMRAGAWSANRDVVAARVSWERARQIADALPDDDPDQLSMRIAPRTMLCATDWQGRAVQESRGRFAELRELCSAAGDKVSLAIGMSGLATELLYAGRCGGLAAGIRTDGAARVDRRSHLDHRVGVRSVRQLVQCRRIRRDLAVVADGHRPGRGRPRQGRRLRSRITAGDRGGISRRRSVVAGPSRMAPRPPRRRRDGPKQRPGNPRASSSPGPTVWRYSTACFGPMTPRCARSRRRCRPPKGPAAIIALIFAEYALGGALLSRDTAADRHRGLELMEQAREWQRERMPSLVPVTELWVARERARRGDRDAAIPVMRKAVDELHQAGRLGYGVWGTGVLVETLLERGAEGDLAEAQEVIDRLANLPADEGSAMRDITLLRLRALLARARGDDVAYRDLVSRYRAMAESLGFEGHIAWAEAMIKNGG